MSESSSLARDRFRKAAGFAQTYDETSNWGRWNGRARLPALMRRVENFWLKRILDVGKQLRCGELTVCLPDGSRRVFEGSLPGPKGLLTLRSSRPLGRIAFGGAIGFAKSYAEQEWDTPDLPQLLELLARNERAYSEHYHASGHVRWLRKLQHLMRPNSRRGSRHNIHAHYDLGNEFYALWLDASMTYSSALFERDDLSLETAQAAKYANLAREIDLKSGQHVLEIGCGWGGFAEFAAREVGAKVTAITISEEQHRFAAERIQTAGLNDKVEIKLQDYRDVETRFDRIASIEMFEAVGERYWSVFFEKLVACLKPGGTIGLQVITIADRYFDNYRKNVDFIQRYIFPGGMLPSPKILDRELLRVGLTKTSDRSFGEDYATTLAAWHARFQNRWPSIARHGFDMRFKRLWQFYLAYCEAGFKTGATDVHQIAAKPL